ncbi:MAG: thermonuclease family protein [Hyphomonadaceae bacterium]|nr:thermonuclease family protein [Hyphomonadaceae bacterium]
MGPGPGGRAGNRVWAALALLAALSACGPKLDGLEKGETGKTAVVRDGDTFEMEGGLVVHLAGVEAPRGEQPRAKEARAALEKFVAHRTVQLAYGGEKRAREAAVAQVFSRTEGGRWVWVQQAMLLAGEARVRTRRGNEARMSELMAAEDGARRARRGLWADPAYAVRPAASLAKGEADIAADADCVAERAAFAAARAAREEARAEPREEGREGEEAKDEARIEERPRRPRRARDFHIVEGRVASVAERERAVFVNFGDDIARDFAVLIPKDALETWPGGLASVTALEGKAVRVRGDVPRCAKPLMRVDHAAQLEMVKP